MSDNTNKKQLFWSRKMIEKLIQIYKENECLYDMNHRNYNNKLIKAEALKNILQKMQQYLPNLNLHDVQEKIKAIRKQYATELAFIEEAQAMGNKYESNLWCFEQMEFLRKHIVAAKATGPINEETSFNYENNHDNEDANSDDSEISLYTESNNLPRTKRKFQWNRDELQIFIKTLKKYPILYNPNHKDYSNRDLRCLERNKVLNEMKKVNREINLNDIRDKMRCLRKQFMKEVRLLKKAHASNNTYVPKLWCFRRLADLYRYEINITGFYTEHIKNDASSTTSTNDLQQTIDNEHNDDSVEFQEIEQFIEDENSEVYEVETLTVPTIDISQNNEDMENIIEEDLEDQPPAKKLCLYNASYENKAKKSNIDINNSALDNKFHHDYAKHSNINEDNITYEWLGDLVVEQLAEIAPKHRTDFAWDVQCLIRKYVMKTRTDNSEINSLLETSNKTAKGNKKSKTSHDLILPKSGNQLNEEMDFIEESNNEDSDNADIEKAKRKAHSWDREQTIIFIKLLKQHPLLYNPKHKDYTNSTLRKIEHIKLLKKVRNLDRKININDVRKKIHTLRTQYVREVTLLKKAYENNENYLPKLWCFDTLINMYKDDLTQYYYKKTKIDENVTTSIEDSLNANEDDDYDMEKVAMTTNEVSQDNMHVNDETNFNEKSNDGDYDVDAFSEDSDNSVQEEKTKREYRWDRDHLKLFIKMIKQHPLLYDTQHKDYTNNAARKIELNKLLQKVKKLDSKITMNIMRQKIRSLRTQYQREVRYLKMAYEKNEFYIPKLWCFDKLSNLYNDDLTPFYKKDDKHNENNIISMEDTNSDYSFDLEEIPEVFEAYQAEDDQNKVEHTAILNDEEIQASNLENECIDTIIEETLENPLVDHNTNLKHNYTQSSTEVERVKHNNCNNNAAVNYEWLGDLVVSQLPEIAPSLHTEFAWDVQCLIRKYILKTQTNRDEASTSKSSTIGNVSQGKSSSTSHDLLLPKTSNVSFNISFV